MSTTVLPSLPLVGGCVTQQVLHTIAPPVDTKHSKLNDIIKRVNLVKVGKGKSPLIANNAKIENQVDVTSYRNSFFQNLCTTVLEQGYHLAFRELFNLVKEAQEVVASDDSTNHKHQRPLEEDKEKLTYMKDMLVEVELLKRQGRTEKIYDSQLALALYFDSHNDFFLSDHFYTSAHHTSCHIRVDGGQKEAEANCNLGKAAERKKDYQKALELYEKFYHLTKDQPWTTNTNPFSTSLKPGGSEEILLYQVACQHLLTAHVAFSSQLPAGRKEEVLGHLHQAHQLAKEGGDNQEIGRIGYLIGNKYDLYGDQESAVKYHTEFFDLCKTTQNEAGMGRACQALAVANKRQGNYKEAIDNLKQFLKVTEENGDDESRREACSDIGSVYNMMGKYEQAANHYKKAYELASKQAYSDDDSTASSAKPSEKTPTTSLVSTTSQHEVDFASCEYAVALAHGLLTGGAEHVAFNDTKSLRSLLYWKSDRLQSFSKDHRTFSMFQTLENRQEEDRKLQERRKSRQLERINLSTVNFNNNNNVDVSGVVSAPPTPNSMVLEESENENIEK